MNAGKVVEIVFPASVYEGECLGVCEVPANVSVEEALRSLRERLLIGTIFLNVPCC